jgi:outer membrane protein assembly factor BamE (lipoprotein component of BamABCDE complex)
MAHHGVRSITRLRGLAAVAAVPLLLGGCSLFEAPRDPRGARLDAEVVKELVPGVQTRRDVLALLGTPTLTPAFDDLTWFYVGGITRQRVARRQSLEEQEVVAVHFALDGTVERVEQLTLADATPVRLVARETPTPGTERTLLQQLLGNVGRFGAPGSATNSRPSGGSGGGFGGQ